MFSSLKAFNFNILVFIFSTTILFISCTKSPSEIKNEEIAKETPEEFSNEIEKIQKLSEEETFLFFLYADKLLLLSWSYCEPSFGSNEYNSSYLYSIYDVDKLDNFENGNRWLWNKLDLDSNYNLYIYSNEFKIYEPSIIVIDENNREKKIDLWSVTKAGNHNGFPPMFRYPRELEINQEISFLDLKLNEVHLSNNFVGKFRFTDGEEGEILSLTPRKFLEKLELEVKITKLEKSTSLGKNVVERINMGKKVIEFMEDKRNPEYLFLSIGELKKMLEVKKQIIQSTELPFLYTLENRK